MDTNLITYLACISFIFIFGRIFILPLKKILKLILNSILGGVAIYLINIIGQTFAFHIGLNFVTSVVIRFVRFTRGCVFNCCKTFSWIMANEGQVQSDHFKLVILYLSLIYYIIQR